MIVEIDANEAEVEVALSNDTGMTIAIREHREMMIEIDDENRRKRLGSVFMETPLAEKDLLARLFVEEDS